MSEPLSITAFIDARLDDDERFARAASMFVDGNGEDDEDPGDRWLSDRAFVYTAIQAHGIADAESALHSHGPDFARHIAQHDPARVLREVTLHRALAAPHRRDDWFEFDDDTTGSCKACSWYGEDYRKLVRWPCAPLRGIADIWSDHPDYRKEWAL